jgi:hypothetical protein
MRKIFPFIILFSIYVKVNAQVENYNGPAKSFVNSFWQMLKMTIEIVEKGNLNAASRIENMDKTIKIIKEKDPTYNTSTMVEEVKKLRDILQSKSGAYQRELNQILVQKEKEKQDNDNKEKSDRSTQNKITSLLTFLFDGNIDDHIPREMKLKTEEMLALDRSGYSGFEVWVKRIRKRAEEAQVRYPKLEKICKEQTKLIEIKNYYRHFQSYQSYFDAAQQIFPEEKSFGLAYSLVTNILNGLGDENNLQDLVAKNYEQKMKDTRLPVAKVKDAVLEKLFMDAYDKMYSESHKGKATKAIIVSDDWQIQRNDVTGIVTGRLRKGAIVYKNSDGKCRLIEEFFIQQEYVGNSFVGTKSVYAVGKGQEMLCEYAK